MNFKTDMNVASLRTNAKNAIEAGAQGEAKAAELIAALYTNKPLADLLPPPENIVNFVLGMKERGMSIYTVKAELEATELAIPFLVPSDQEVLGRGVSTLIKYRDLLDGEANPNPMLDQAIGGCAASLLNAMLENEDLSVVGVKVGLENQNLPAEFITAVMHRLNVVVAYLAANA